MFPLLAPRFNRLRMEREEDSITTLQVWELVADTFIFTFSVNVDDKQIVVTFHAAEFRPLFKQSFDGLFQETDVITLLLTS